jgi:hypothetical protein
LAAPILSSGRTSDQANKESETSLEYKARPIDRRVDETLVAGVGERDYERVQHAGDRDAA